MKTRFALINRLLVGILAVSLAMPAAAQVTFSSLLSEMTDLARLAEFPSPAFTCSQFSSYDRRSTDPTVLTDENWFANADTGQFIRVEEKDGRREWVLMDIEGPGAIVRIWSANANDAGTVRIYLDGAEQPTLEMPLQDMLNGKNWPYLTPIGGIRAMGWNSYLPLPYAKHCKVTTDRNRYYYQINYRTYEKGTVVESYKPEMAEANRAAIDAVAATLAKPQDFRPAARGARQEEMQLRLGAGASGSHSVSSGGAIFRFALTVSADDIEEALRKTLLSVTFDDEKAPSILCPVGDFFGAAPGLNPYFGLPLGVDWEGEMYCNWVMPYKSKAVIRFINHTAKPVVLSGTLTTAPRPWTDRSMYFHAKWRMEHPIPTRPRQDWTYLFAKGKGVYVGDSLNVTNPVTAWWGEGDEKIYVDGETFPSTFGTGTEDYYGYAWCSPEVFTHAYHNQPRCDGPGNFGQTSVNRFHIIDEIPYNTSFKFDMEVWHWVDTEVGMAVTAYWYARPGGTDDFPPITPKDLRIPPLPEPLEVEGALEGEELKVLERTGGTTERQGMEYLTWSSGAHLWWRNAEVGDTLTLAVPVEKAGRYELVGAFTRAPDYGIVQLSLNGVALGEPMDFYARGISHSRERSLGTFDLPAGDSKLTVKITGRNERARPGNMFGLDYLLLKPVR